MNWLRRVAFPRLFTRRASRTRTEIPRPRLTAERLEDRTLLSGSGALGAASDFNLFVLGRLSQSYTDSEGRVAAGGDVSLTDYGVGDALTNAPGGRDDLIVGGNLTYSQGQVFHGNVVYGGSASLSNVGLPNGTARQGTPLDFAAAGSQLTALAASWAALTPNGKTADSYGTITLTGTDPALDVFTVSAAELGQANALNLSAPAGSSVLVNVTGTTGQMQNMGVAVSGTDQQHVVFNFAAATSLTLGGISVPGSVLAPRADVSFNNGNLSGTLVAASLTGNGEFHNAPTQVQINAAPPAAGRLSGTLFLDTNKDGARQSGEAGVAGGTLTLKDNTGKVVGSTTSGADGSYSFGNLPAGTYTVTETAPAGYGTSTLTSCTVTVAAGATAGQDFGVTTGSLAGSVFVDANDDGVRQVAEAGVAGVTVTLTGTDAAGRSVRATATTGTDGSYYFPGVLAGTYTVTETPPAGYADGKAAAGTAGGTPGTEQVSAIGLKAGVDTTGYTFAEVSPSCLAGFVYVDANNDGIKQTAEVGIAGVNLTLTGKDDRGQAVSQTTTTDATGAYLFSGLRPGAYVLAETQPTGYGNGKDTIGSQGGTVGADQFTLTLKAGVQGRNNNFGELAQALGHGQTATIGFWQGPNGQALIKSFGTTASGQTLAGWLAATFPNLYGQGGMHDLTGRTDADVAALFVTLFGVKGQKTEAQILATALAVFTTTNALDTGSASRALAAKYGFVLSDAGTGAALWNVGSNNTAFGVAANASVSVLSLLLTTSSRVAKGQLFGGDATLTNQANSVFSGINQSGDIS